MKKIKSNKRGVSIFAVILSIFITTILTYIIIRRRSPEAYVATHYLERTSTWMQHVNLLMNRKKSGKFSTKDKKGIPVIFEWEKVLCKDPGSTDNMRAIADLLCMPLSGVELEKLRKYPEYTNEIVRFFAKNKGEGEFQNLIDEGIIKENTEKGRELEILDCDRYKQKIAEHMKSILYNFEISHKHFGVKDEDILIFIKVKGEKTKKLIGSCIFWINYSCEYGHVILWNMALEQKSQGRGLGKLLASSIFKILPDIKTIGLGVYSTNERAIGAYKAWGFVEKEESGEIKGFRSLRMDYLAKKTNILQKAAESLSTVE